MVGVADDCLRRDGAGCEGLAGLCVIVGCVTAEGIGDCVVVIMLMIGGSGRRSPSEVSLGVASGVGTVGRSLARVLRLVATQYVMGTAASPLGTASTLRRGACIALALLGGAIATNVGMWVLMSDLDSAAVGVISAMRSFNAAT